MNTSREIPRPLFEVIYFCAVLLLTILYTYPLVFNLSGSFYGLPWDSLGGMRDFWWLKFSHNLDLEPNLHTHLAYPFGFDLSNSPSTYLFNFVGFTLTSLTDEVVAYNIIKIVGFPLLAHNLLVAFLPDRQQGGKRLDRVGIRLLALSCNSQHGPFSEPLLGTAGYPVSAQVPG